MGSYSLIGFVSFSSKKTDPKKSSSTLTIEVVPSKQFLSSVLSNSGSLFSFFFILFALAKAFFLAKSDFS